MRQPSSKPVIGSPAKIGISPTAPSSAPSSRRSTAKRPKPCRSMISL